MFDIRFQPSQNNARDGHFRPSARIEIPISFRKFVNHRCSKDHIFLYANDAY